MSRIIGIDLGTSTSEVAILEDGKPKVIPNSKGQIITPSVVGIDQDGNLLIGQDARDQMLLRPQDTAIEVKRLMGSGQKVSMGGKEYTPQQISSFILKYLKECAENYLGEEITRAVITVPAYFTDEQRRATVEAGNLAGLKVERIINEPTAAALAYGIDHMQNNQYILVYDLGGGTLDVTVLEMFEGVLEVKASSGNNKLGGKDFDQRLMDWLIDEFKAQYDIDLSNDVRALARIKEAAEACKIALSTQEQYKIELPFIAEKEGKPVALERVVTRELFENLIKDLVESTIEPINIALGDSGLTKDDIDLVFMVGGSTRIPLVRRFLESVMGRQPVSPVDPDLAVAMGAAIQAGIINQELSAEKDIVITDVCPYTLGVEVLEFVGGFPVPDMYDVIIPRNTTIPVVREKIYGTVVDNQKKVEIKVYQGDYKKASMNNFLGKFILDGIPPAPAFKEKIKVRFSYDVNGILNVEGIILSTNKKAGITIETTGVKMEEEMDLSNWKEVPKARKYRGIIRRAERLLNEAPDSPLFAELDGAVKDLKKALLKEEDDVVLEELAEALSDLLYDIEDEG
ncbi:molecular chaperone DnaK [Caldicoprobacter guelmensis]|uniref:Hsp70 family protein n=1 Tax=Caldicoprobacter guelmensis TaxID=1170224 RepID=UPI001956492D|nr:Hsp70 family protein [Caldicoprobacter guelmensis]MBM7583194.1 molecular chaperone DnaK [Caldicoprobacter guelmensis]